MYTQEENTPHMTGSVEWYDAPPCAVHAATLHDCGLDALSTGDRVRFRGWEESDERAATDLALLLAEQRWENGGTVHPKA